jgi:hypothetical protein
MQKLLSGGKFFFKIFDFYPQSFIFSWGLEKKKYTSVFGGIVTLITLVGIILAI